MADKALSDLELVSDFRTDDALLVQRGEEAKRATGEQILEYAQEAAKNVQRGYRGYSIASITLKSGESVSSGVTNTYIVTFDNNQSVSPLPTQFQVYNGEDGDKIVEVEETSVTHNAGEYDTYTFVFDSGYKKQFKVYNGANGGGSFSVNETTETLVLKPTV